MFDICLVHCLSYSLLYVRVVSPDSALKSVCKCHIYFAPLLPSKHEINVVCSFTFGLPRHHDSQSSFICIHVMVFQSLILIYWRLLLFFVAGILNQKFLCRIIVSHVCEILLTMALLILIISQSILTLKLHWGPTATDRLLKWIWCLSNIQLSTVWHEIGESFLAKDYYFFEVFKFEFDLIHWFNLNYHIMQCNLIWDHLCSAIWNEVKSSERVLRTLLPIISIFSLIFFILWWLTSDVLKSTTVSYRI